MRGLRSLFVAALAIAIVGFAAAQPPRGGQGKGGFGGMFQMRGTGGAMLLGQESVQKELKITDDQKTKIKDFNDKQAEKRREMFASFRDGGGDPEKAQAAMKEAAEAADKFVKDTLNADQQKRLKQITWQRAGIAVFMDKDVATPLKLTDEQTSKMKTMGEELAEDMRGIFQEARGNQQEMQQKIAALNKETMEKAEDLLTADQKKQFTAMLGPKFEGKIEMQPGGGRGGFRKGGDKGGNKDGEKKVDEKKKRGDG